MQVGGGDTETDVGATERVTWRIKATTASTTTSARTTNTNAAADDTAPDDASAAAEEIEKDGAIRAMIVGHFAALWAPTGPVCGGWREQTLRSGVGDASSAAE